MARCDPSIISCWQVAALPGGPAAASIFVRLLNAAAVEHVGLVEIRRLQVPRGAPLTVVFLTVTRYRVVLRSP